MVVQALFYLLLQFAVSQSLGSAVSLSGQENLSPYCPNTVPSYTINLSGSPTGIWNSPSNVGRNDQCNCTLGTESCVEFVITLHPNAVGFVLRKTAGSQAGGNQDFIVNGDCSNIGTLDERFCLTGTGPYYIAYCESGGNSHTYQVESIESDLSAPSLNTAVGCNTQINVTGSVDASTATWTTVSDNADLSYLSSSSGTLNPIFTPPASGSTQTYEYQVCANSNTSICDNVVGVCTNVTITVTPDIVVSVPDNSFCADDPNWNVTVGSVSPSGTYLYDWTGGGGSGVNLTTTNYAGSGGGTKTLQVIDQNFTDNSGNYCRIGTATFNITEKPVPVAQIIAPPVICSGTQLQFSAQNSGVPGTNYSWSFPGGSPSSASGIGPHNVTFSNCSDKTITLTTSVNGCTDTDQVTLTGDNTPPTISNPPGNQNVECGNIPAVPDISSLVSDNCSSVNWNYSETSTAGGCGGQYTITRTWDIFDACGNTITHIQRINVDDTTDPVVNPLPNGGTYSCIGDVPAPNTGIVSATDVNGCSSLTVTFIGDSGNDYCGGTLMRTYRVRDDCGNFTDVTQNFTIDDNTVPSISCPAGFTVDCDGEVPSALGSWSAFLSAGGSGSDNCGLNTGSFGVSQTSTGLCPKNITRTYRISDNCGNTSTCQQVITVDPPANTWINPPGTITITCDQALGYSIPSLSYTNNLSGTCANTGSVAGNIVSGSFNECGGQWTIEWNYTDACTRTITHQQIINISPAPVADWVNAPGPISISCDAAQNYSIPNLSYTNGESGSCQIAGSVPGSLQSGTFNECGGSFTLFWTFTDDCGNRIDHTQEITIDPAPEADWVNPPGATTISCDQAQNYVIPSLSYTNGETGDCEISGSQPASGLISGYFDECGGDWTINWSFTDDCSRNIFHTQDINITEAPEAQWINAPANITISCADALNFTPSILNYSNSESGVCAISGSAMPVMVQDFTECGGSITVDWDYTDDCGRNIHHTQTITVEQATLASWINPPANTTISCDAALSFTAPDLFYTNGESSTCEIAGSVSPVITTDFDECGGTITVDWDFNDNCSRNIHYTQVVNVDPAPAATWVNPPPATLNITCDEATTFTAPTIDYSNAEAGVCLISGTINPVIVYNYDECGGTITVDWDFNDACGRNLHFTQNVTVQPAPIASWINAPGPLELTCDQAQNYIIPQLSYTNSGLGSCLIDGSVPGNIIAGGYDECDGQWTIRWTYTDDCMRTIVHDQIVTINPAPSANWINPPAAMTISCDEAQNYVIPSLSYTNGETGNCEISGSVPGTLQSGSFTECGGDWIIAWTFTDDCGNRIDHTQEITISPAPTADWVNPPDPITITCDQAQNYVIPSLNYTNGETGDCEISGSQPAGGLISGYFDECGGNWTINWSFTDACSRTIDHSQDITIQSAPEAVWISPPTDLVISCADALNFTPSILNYSNSESGVCAISGSAMPVMVQNFTECGGTIRVDWDYTDDCNRNIHHTQHIIVEPAPVAGWINQPANTTISCDAALSFTAPDLFYTNGESSTCEIAGSVSPVITNDYNECGGTITVDWDFNDNCSRNIHYTQVVTVDPAPAATWVNPPPATLNITCDEATTFTAPTIDYSNAEAGVCLISGTINPVIVTNFTECGGTITVDWDFTDNCGRNLHFTQNVTVQPAPTASWIDAPGPLELTCDEAQNYTIPDLSYSNGGLGVCLIEGSVPGSIQSGNFTECGGSWVLLWEYTDDCGNRIEHTQDVNILPAAPPQWVNAPGPITLTCDAAQNYIIPNLSYSNGETGQCQIAGDVPGTVQSGSFDECGGSWIIAWTFTDDCGTTIDHTQEITISPAPTASWINPPAATTISCDQAQNYVIPDLAYSNGETGDCEISGSVPGTLQTGTFDECGGSWVLLWEFTDDCGNRIEHTQDITIQPAPEATWVNAPGPISISCDAALSFTAPDLFYSNSETNSCEIAGSVPPVITTNFTECGGTITVDWDFTDNCLRNIHHTQIVTVEPAPIAEWVSPPAATTISCDAALSFTAPDLFYTNGESNTCEIAGSVPPVITTNFDECGGTITVDWDFNDNCLRNIHHTQIVTVEPAPAATWVNPPLDALTITCDEATSFTAPTIDYSNAEAGVCLISGTINPVIVTNYSECGGTITVDWDFTDNCGRNLHFTQNVTVQPAPTASWIDPPGPLELTCDEAQNYTIPDLSYSNGGLGVCLIEGSVPGTIQSGSFTECGGSWVLLWEFTDDCGNRIEHTQDVNILPAAPPQWVNAPGPITLTCDQAQNYIIPNLSYSNGETGQCQIAGDVPGTIQSGSFDECGGSWIIAWTFTDDCGTIIDHTQEITIDPAPTASWVNPPAATTISCDQAQNYVIPSLSYTNGETGDCEIAGSVPGTLQTGTFDECGGSWVLLWEFTDDCGNRIEHTQDITIQPAPEATWVNAPGPISISCDAALSFTAPDLFYTNSETNSCEIAGSVPPVITTNFTECGGTITVDWDFTDNCLRNIHHTQIVTVEPAPIAEWVNPPAATTISCDAALSFTAPDLFYTNGESSTCEIAGSVPPVITTNFDECGGTITVDWDFNDNCSRNIHYTQVVTVDPAPAATWVNPPPATLNITCDEATAFTAPTIDYSNAESGVCLISGTINPVIVTNFTECGGTITVDWDFTDNCGRNLHFTQNVIVQPAPTASWIDAPGPLELTCDEAQNYTIPDLSYSNGGLGVCLIEGSVPGTIQSGSFTECGGSWVLLWEYTDDCGNRIEHTQDVNILPAAPPQWVNAPGPITLTCDAAQNYIIPNLSYSNGETGQCQIAGDVPGTIQSGSFDECGGSWIIAWTFTDDCGTIIDHTQEITIDPAPTASWVNPPTATTISCDQAQNYVVPALNYTNGETGDCEIAGSVPGTLQTGTFDECGGSWVLLWEFTDDCGNRIEHMQDITIQPAPEATWVNAPGPISISCDAALSFTAPDLFYTNSETNSCEIAGSVPPVITTNFTECGGTITVDWDFTDNCSRNIHHTQVVTVDPAPIANWVNPPANTTISCDAALSFNAPDLFYTNGESSTCEIAGSVTPVITTNFDECGGTITVDWDFNDNCSRNIHYTQVVTVDPAPAATWVNPPPDALTITCDEATAFTAPTINYSNAESGVCLISGTINPVIVTNFTECGGTITVDWDFTDNCGRNLHFTQNVSVEPAPTASWIDPPGPLELTCDEAQNYVIPPLSYSNGGLGTCLIAGSVPGTIQSGSFTECGGSWVLLWEYTDDCGNRIEHTQDVNILPAAPPQWVNAPGPITLTCDQAQNYIIPNLSYSNGETGQCQIAGDVPGTIQSGSFTECGGSWIIAWTFTDDCGTTIDHTQEITISPAPTASWINPPTATTISCDQAQNYVIPSLSYTNGETGDCEIAGSVPGTLQTGTFDECGGSWVLLWEFTDDCGNRIEHTQDITIQPAPEATWVNPPAPITISCDAALSFTAPDLFYSNSETNSCEIAGSVPPVITTNFTECGGTITVDWDFTDNCSRNIHHTQVVTVDPAPIANWVNPPAPITISCDAALSFTAPDLFYTNGESSTCEIAGSVPPVITTDFDECGGTITVDWDFNDNCSRNIHYTQVVTVDPAPAATWVNPPLDALTITCDEATSFTAPTIDYSNAEAGVCLISGTADPSISANFTECGGTITVDWDFTDNCGRNLHFTQNVTVQPAPTASWINPPSNNLILTCDEAQNYTIPDLSYSNGGLSTCLIAGSVPGAIQSGTFNACGGGWVLLWEYTDDCGNRIEHTQNVTIQPAASPTWVNAPGPITLTCDQAQNYVIPNLSYSNGETGQCQIAGDVPGTIQSGSFTECGGSWIIAWTFTDDCGTTIDHTQEITIDPAPEATWINPPTATTISCDQAQNYVVPALNYTNGETGDCEIAGSQAASSLISGFFDECGGGWQLSWSYTDDCNRTIDHSQEVTISAASEAVWINAPADIVISCAEAFNFSPNILNYSNSESGVCAITG